MDNPFAHSAEAPVLGADDQAANEIEPLSLSELFPKDSRDLDKLFPEQEIRQLFQDIVGDLQEVERFKRRTDKQLERELRSDRKATPVSGPTGWKNILSR